MIEKIRSYIGQSPNHKLLGIGLFWLISYITIKHTDATNLPYILTILMPGLIASAGVHGYFNMKQNQLDNQNQPDNATNNSSSTNKTQ